MIDHNAPVRVASVGVPSTAARRNFDNLLYRAQMEREEDCAAVAVGDAEMETEAS